MNTYQQLEQVARNWMNEIWIKQDLSKFDQIHHPDFRDLSPAGRESDRNSYRLGIEEFYTFFPDFKAFVEDIVIDTMKSKVSIRWSANATHRGKIFGLEPTFRNIFFQGIEIITINDQGQITERWGEWDGLSILEQITREDGNAHDKS